MGGWPVPRFSSSLTWRESEYTAGLLAFPPILFQHVVVSVRTHKLVVAGLFPKSLPAWSDECQNTEMGGWLPNSLPAWSDVCQNTQIVGWLFPNFLPSWRDVSQNRQMSGWLVSHFSSIMKWRVSEHIDGWLACSPILFLHEVTCVRTHRWWAGFYPIFFQHNVDVSTRTEMNGWLVPSSLSAWSDVSQNTQMDGRLLSARLSIILLLAIWLNVPRQPLHNYPPGHALEGGGHRDWQRQCWMDNVKKWTSLPMPELLTLDSRRKRLEEDLCWIVHYVPPRDWTEPMNGA